MLHCICCPLSPIYRTLTLNPASYTHPWYFLDHRSNYPPLCPLGLTQIYPSISLPLPRATVYIFRFHSVFHYIITDLTVIITQPLANTIYRNKVTLSSFGNETDCLTGMKWSGRYEIFNVLYGGIMKADTHLILIPDQGYIDWLFVCQRKNDSLTIIVRIVYQKIALP